MNIDSNFSDNNNTLIIHHYMDYLNLIIQKDIIDTNTIDSNNMAIIEYYKNRIIPESEYFDSYAYIKNMNENVIDNDYIYHFNKYMKMILSNEFRIEIINYNKTYDSIINFITTYYKERIKINSKYFDPYTYVNDSNKNMLVHFSEDESEQTSDSSEDESEQTSDSSEDESDNDIKQLINKSNNLQKDEYLDEFNETVNNENILLYKKSKMYIERLEMFLDLNDYY
jgi:hypothetical protein